MEKILVTGGAGFIGSNLVKKLSKNNLVYVVDDFSMGREENLLDVSNVKIYKKSVLDNIFMEELFQKNQFKYIFHLAAIASVADSVVRPVETHRVNFDSTLNILEYIKKYQKNLARLVFSSSAAVYGDEKSVPKTEESPIKPMTPYAVDKFSSEKYVLNSANLYGVKSSATRFFNVYGINQNPSSPYSGVISILLDKYKAFLNNERIHFTVFGDGNQSRDFVYVDDVTDALLFISKSDETLGQVYNIGYGKEVTINEIIKEVNELLNIELPVEFKEKRDGDIYRSFADITKLKSIGFNHSYTFQTGLKEYIKHEFQTFLGGNNEKK